MQELSVREPGPIQCSEVGTPSVVHKTQDNGDEKVI